MSLYRSFWLLLFNFCLCLFASASQLRVQLSDDFSAHSYLYLIKASGLEKSEVADSAKYNPAILFDISHIQAGLYYLIFDKKNTVEIILSPAENPEVKLSRKDFERGFTQVTNSKENDAYAELIQYYAVFDSSLQTLFSSHFNEFSPQAITELQMRSRQLELMFSQLNQALDIIRSKYPGTYMAEVICPLLHKRLIPEAGVAAQYDNYLAYFNEHFFDGTNFSDPRLLHHYFIHEQLRNYFRYFVPKTEPGIKKAIDYLYAQMPDTGLVRNYVSAFLLRNFLKSSATDLAAYVNDKTKSDLCDLGLNAQEQEKLNRLIPLENGKKIETILLETPDQQKIDLLQTAAEHKLTLVFIWMSTCPHCRDAIKELKNLYQQYHPNGFEIYAISLDENKMLWRDAINEFQLPWINVSEPGSLAQFQSIGKYHVQKTPTFLLIDENGTLQLGDFKIAALSAVLAKQLK